MHPENKKEFELSNLIQFHNAGYTGKGIKIASPEPLAKRGSEHGYFTALIRQQSAPDSIMFDVDYTKWGNRFPEFIDDCIENGVDIIMNALMFSLEEADKTAIKKATDAGIIYLSAIGNENIVREDNSNAYSTDVREFNGYIQVGALILYGEKAKIERANYSNKGKLLDYVEFTNIWTEKDAMFSGTSCATPFLAGKIACLLQFMKENNIPKSEWRNIVDSHLIDLGVTGRDDLYGRGFFTLPDLEKFNVEGDNMSKAIRDLNELLPQVKELAEQLIEKCKLAGIPIMITETYRSQERQNELYAQGRTTEGKIVTWTLNSKHKTRKAFDFVPLTNGQANWNDLKLFAKIGEIGKSLGLTYGGDWKTPDRPHFQYDGEIKEKVEANVMEEVKVEIPEVSDWAKEAWEWAKENKLNDGEGAKNNVSEEQLMVFMYRLYNLLHK